MPRTKKLEIEAVIQDEENTALEVAKSDVEVSDFELVTNIVVGKLTSNAKEFSAALENELKNYTTYLFRFRYNFLEITEFYSL